MKSVGTRAPTAAITKGLGFNAHEPIYNTYHCHCNLGIVAVGVYHL